MSNALPNTSPVAGSSVTRDELAFQLQTLAENALSVALWHVRRPVINAAGAARKVVQALALLQELRTLQNAAGSPLTRDEGKANG